MSLEDLTPDELLAHAQRQEGSAQLLAALAGNPKTREALQRLIKTIDPKIPIPEIDTRDAVVDGIIKPLTTKMESLEKQLMERDARDRLSGFRGAIKQKYRLSDEEVTAVEALMTDAENPIPTHDAAARVYLASRSSTAPTPALLTPATYEMPEKDIWAPGIGNPVMLNRIAIQEATKAWNELQSGKIPGLGAARGAPMN